MNQFQIGRVLGEGTFSKVYQATHLRTKLKVAIKVLQKSKIKNRQDHQRINKQISILKTIDHQNIIKLYQIIEDSNAINLIIQYAQEGDLLIYLKKNKKLSQFETQKIIYQLSRAVNYLHQKGIVHRDIKMGNILLDKQFNVKLADFGLSNTFQDDETLKTSTGSPCFAAPQVIEGKQYYPKPCDVWSIGVVMYCLLSGNLPFYHQNIYQLFHLVLNGIYKKLTFVSQEAQKIVDSMLQVKPSNRIKLEQLLQSTFFKAAKSIKSQQNVEKKDIQIKKILSSYGYNSNQIEKQMNKQSQNDFSSKIKLIIRILQKTRLEDLKKLKTHKNSQFKQKTISLKKVNILSNSNSNNISKVNDNAISSHKRFLRSNSKRVNKLNPLSSMKKIKQNMQGITYLKTPSKHKQIDISPSQIISKLSYNSKALNKSIQSNSKNKNEKVIYLKQQKADNIDENQDKQKQINIHYGPYNFSHVIHCNLDYLKNKMKKKSIELFNKSYQMHYLGQFCYQLKQNEKQSQKADIKIRFSSINNINNLHLVETEPHEDKLIIELVKQIQKNNI